jgi:hypothetical protein
VSMEDNEFVPANITVAPGEAITWTNNGENPHTATADSEAFDTGTVESGQSASVTIDTPGSYPYYCRFHGAPGGIGMAGTITVEGGDGGDGGGGEEGGEPPLPQTATPLPLIGGLGVVLLLTGLWLGRRRLTR